MTTHTALTTTPTLGVRENPAYLTDQLITYIGNKRALLPVINSVLAQIRTDIGRPLVSLDAFAGSGVVSRLLKSWSSMVIANDLEPYSAVLGDCYLTDCGDVDWPRLRDVHRAMVADVDNGRSVHGFVEELYAPADDDHIAPGERVFYTRDNARRLDTFATIIHHEVDPALRPYLLAPLLASASVHANTSGVFKGFHKDRTTGVGRFGGTHEDALLRIKGRIEPRLPVLSKNRSAATVLTVDANRLPDLIGPVDVAYLDPPYNQHPYGSNYFMLNLLTDYHRPVEISPISGIPVGWKRSEYNIRRRSADLLRELVTDLAATYLLISFNDDGFIRPDEMRAMLCDVGTVTDIAIRYHTFRGSRNLYKRSAHVTEHLFVVKKRRHSDCRAATLDHTR